MAFAAVEAIKRLIAERAALRSLVTTQEHELVRLRDHLNLIRISYRRLANELVTSCNSSTTLMARSLRNQPQNCTGSETRS